MHLFYLAPTKVLIKTGILLSQIEHSFPNLTSSTPDVIIV